MDASASAPDGGPPPHQPGRGSQVAAAFDLLRRNADFRNLFLSSTVSFLGDWFALVAVSALVKEVTGSEGATALVFAAEVLPIFLVSPLAGVVADRVDRKRLMIAADLLRIVPALLLVVASLRGQAWLAYVCVASISALAAFFQPVVSAVVPNVVDQKDLTLAQTTIGAMWGAMLFVGAAVGGFAAQAFGREASFVMDAATFLASAILLWRVRKPFGGRAVTAAASVFAHLGEVWRFVQPRKLTRAFMTTKAGIGVGNGIVGILPVYALDRFGAGEFGIGVLLAGRGLGALVGPFVGRALSKHDGRRLVLVCGSSIVAYAVAYALLPAAPTLWVAAILVTLAHSGGGNQWVTSTEGLQLSTPDAIRGRVLSLDFGLATLAMGLSALLAGALAEVFGVAVATLVLAGFPFVYGLAWLAWTRDLWTAAEDPLHLARSLVEVPEVQP